MDGVEDSRVVTGVLRDFRNQKRQKIQDFLADFLRGAFNFPQQRCGAHSFFNKHGYSERSRRFLKDLGRN
jgi:hypothetical protein